jgi:hypothetical protein
MSIPIKAKEQTVKDRKTSEFTKHGTIYRIHNILLLPTPHLSGRCQIVLVYTLVLVYVLWCLTTLSTIFKLYHGGYF